MALAILLCWLFPEILALNVQIVTSSQTSPILLLKLQEELLLINVLSQTSDVFSINLESSQISQSIDIAIDLTNSVIYQPNLIKYCENYEIVCLSIYPSTFTYSKWNFCVHTSQNSQVLALNSMISALGWEKLVILAQNDQENLILFEKSLKMMSPAKSDSFSNKDSQKIFDAYTKLTLRILGLKQFLLIGDGEFSSKFIFGLENNLIYQYSGFLMTSSSVFCTNCEKGVILAEKGIENATSIDDFHVKAILIYVLNAIQYQNVYFSASKSDLQVFFESITLNHYKFPIFSIVNVINSQKVIIGSIQNAQIFLTKNITFPYVNPDNSLLEIVTSMSFNNPLGFPNATQVISMQLGGIFAVNLVKMQGQLLQNRNLVLNLASCGSEFFVEQLSLYCWMQTIEKMGIFYLTSPVYQVVTGEISVFRMFNLSIPNIGGLVSDPYLSNTTAYPTFTRVIASIDNSAMFSNLIRPLLSWTEFVAVYTNTTENLSIYYGIVALFELKNDPAKRMLPAGYNSSMFETYKYVFQSIADTSIRPLFLIADFPDFFYIAQGLYQIGLRKGDICIFTTNLLSFELNMLPESDFKSEVIEIIEGSVSAFPVEWINEYGNLIKEEMLQAFGEPLESRCYSFDAMMLGINAVNSLLITGNFYEDPSLLNEAIRSQRFQGCSGTVSIDKFSNDRKGYAIGLYNLLFNNATKSFGDTFCAEYREDSDVPFIFYHALTWSTGSTTPPYNSRLMDLDCPFEQRLISANRNATALFYMILLFFVIYPVLVTVIIWKKWWAKEYQQLDQAVSEKIGDYFVMAMIFVDLLQILSMGPDLVSFLFGINVVSNVSSIDIMNFSRFVYWNFFYIALASVFGFIFLAVLSFFKVDQKFSFPLFRSFKELTVTVMPLMSDFLFLPIVYVFFLLFDCSEGISSDLTDSFMDKDCYTFCWQGSHLGYSIVAIFALVLYMPIAIFSRPLWQELEYEINIKTNSVFYMIKGIVQVIIVILNRTIKKFNQSLHGMLIILLVISFALVINKHKPYNYARLNFWRNLSLLVTCWSLIVTSIYYFVEQYDYVWFVLFFLGWIFIAIFGVLTQKRFPNLIYAEKALHIPTLFKFSFSGSVKIESLPVSRMSWLNYATAEKYEIHANIESFKAKE